MSVESNRQDQALTSDKTFNSLSTTSVLSWVQKLQPPYTSSYTPHLLDKIPTQATKRCRSLDSTPSEFLGNGPSFYKRRKAFEQEASSMGGNSAAGMPTSSVEESNSNPDRTPSKSNTTSIFKGTSSTNPQTPKRQKTSTSEDLIGYKMSLHGLLQSDEAFDRASDFKDHITDIVNSERGSTMKEASVRRFRDHANIYKWANEATFLYHMIPILQGDGYHIAVEPVFAPGKEENHKQKAREWKDFLRDEKVIVTLSKDFTRTLLPDEFSANISDEIAKELAKDKDMKNPRPDLAFGLLREKHPFGVDTQIPKQILDLLEIAPGMHHAFLIIEGKSQSGSSAKAENQARRGGATLVKASRLLRATVEGTVPGEVNVESARKAGKPNPVTPDCKSFVFSITMSPIYFEIWVHWFDESNGLYHMNRVESYNLNNSKGPVQIRWALHNIIEWGARTRHAQHEALVRSIENHVRHEDQSIQAEILVAKEDAKAAKAAAKTAKSALQSAGSASRKRPVPEDDA